MTTEQITRLALDSIKNSHVYRSVNGYIYHYTDVDTVKKILCPDSVKLRMTHINSFADKYEGKAIDIYYDLALDKMHQDGIIDLKVRKLLGDITATEKSASYFKPSSENTPTEVKITNQNIYVACFSDKCCDPYMFENYIKDQNKKGYCIKFSAKNLESNQATLSFGKGHLFHLYRVLYGDKIIETLINSISNLISIPDECDEEFIHKWAYGIIRQWLNEMQYLVKMGRYRDENEIRLILSVPYGENIPDYYSPEYDEHESDGKRYTTISLPKNTVFGMDKSDTLSDVEDNQLREALDGYHLIL